MKRWWPFYVLAFLLGLLLARVLSPQRPSAAPDIAAKSAKHADEVTHPAQKAAPKAVAQEQVSRYFRPAVPSSPRSSWSELPDHSLPLAATLPILKARANQGDASAACRLAAELSWCAQARLLPVPSAQANERAQKAHQNYRSHCSGVDEPVLQERFAYLRQAALGGSLEAIESYVSADALIQDAEVAAEFLEAYQREAPQLAEVALQAGSVRIIGEIETAYGAYSGDSWLSRAQSVRWDPARSVLMRKLLNRVLPESAKSGWAPRLDPPQGSQQAIADMLSEQEIRRLDAKADEWHQQWFQGQAQSHTVGPFDTLAVNYSRPDFNDACSKRYIDDPMGTAPVRWPDSPLR